MSTNLYVYIEKLNINTGKYELLQLMHNDTPVDIWPWNANYILFDILRGEQDFEAYHIRRGAKSIPFMSEELRSILRYWGDPDDEKDYMFNLQWTTLADLKHYVYNHPQVVDYYSDDNKPPKIKNPMCDLINRIEVYIDFCDAGWDAIDSDIRVTYFLM